NYLGAARIRCRLDLPVQLPAVPLTTDTRHHLFLVVKEALNNVVKHAAASEVWLRLSVAEDSLMLVVRDNGHGFVPENPKSETRNPKSLGVGHGVPNMRQRVEMLGGRFECKSDLGLGTEIVMSVPLN